MYKIKEAQYQHDGLPYKVGLHGKVFIYLNDEWRLSRKSASEIRGGIKMSHGVPIEKIIHVEVDKTVKKTKQAHYSDIISDLFMRGAKMEAVLQFLNKESNFTWKRYQVMKVLQNKTIGIKALRIKGHKMGLI